MFSLFEIILFLFSTLMDKPKALIYKNIMFSYYSRIPPPPQKKKKVTEYFFDFELPKLITHFQDVFYFFNWGFNHELEFRKFQNLGGNP